MHEVDLTVFATELANGAFVIDAREPDEYRPLDHGAAAAEVI
ncbi:hypothetical protein ACIRP2_28835 [Streptomyces sp. NPDC101194]